MLTATLSSAGKFVRKKQGVLFPVLDVLLNLFNWGYHVLVSWFLLPGDYGRLNALLALLALMMVLGVSLQMLTAKQVAAHGTRVAPMLSRLAWTVGLGGGGLGVLMLPALMVLTRTDAICVLLVLATFVLNAVLSVRRGVAQGQTTFLSLNGSFYLEVIVKLVATWVFLRFHASPHTALLGVLVGMAAALLVSPPLPKTSEVSGEPMRYWVGALGPVLAAQFFLYFFSAVDMLFVNRQLPDEAGIYAVAVKFGQILFLGALSVATVFIPQLARNRDNRALFLKSAQMLVGVVLFAVVAGQILSRTVLPPVVPAVFGHEYAAAGALLPLAMGAFGLLALCFCLVNVLVVLEQRAYLAVLFVAAIGVVGSLLLWAHSASQVLGLLSGVYAVLLAALFVLSFSSKEFKSATKA